MKTGVYFCRCGGIVSDRIDGDVLAKRLQARPDVAYVKAVELSCSDEGRAFISEDLKAERPDRVVILACSPREHEHTFRDVLAVAGMNPFLGQLVNIREQVAWVTQDRDQATDKAVHLAQAAIERVKHHQPLQTEHIDVSTDVLIVGAGPAGLKAALAVAEAGRKAIVVERDAIVGGMPMRYEEIYPQMECGPCLLEPFIAEALHGPHAERIELMLQSEVVALKGSFGNFVATVRSQPRYVKLDVCVGCTECVPACPVSYPSAEQFGMAERKAIDFVFFGGMPNAPYIDPQRCTRLAAGDGCNACVDACPVPGAIDFGAGVRSVERQVGAIVLAVGGSLYDVAELPALGHGQVPGVVTSIEMERMLSSNGPSGGVPRMAGGEAPGEVGIVHCVGSLDERHRDYCSGICCMGAFKINQIVAHKLPGARVTHYYKTLAVSGKEEGRLYRKAACAEGTELLRFDDIDDIAVTRGDDGRPVVSLSGAKRAHDLVVLMPAMVPSASVRSLSKVLDVPIDRDGWFEEMHGRVGATASKIRGIYMAGTCHGPMDLGQAMTQGMAAAGAVLAALVPGRQLELEAVHAEVDAETCTACYTCIGVCPYKAITGFAGRKAQVDAALCTGCGTCVATCPTGSMHGRHFNDEQIFAEIEGALS